MDTPKLVRRWSWTARRCSYEPSMDYLATVTEWTAPAWGAFVVRENIARRGECFQRGGGVNVGLRHGRRPARADQVLDLLCAPEHAAAVAEWVRAVDPMGREVRVGVRGFTWAWLCGPEPEVRERRHAILEEGAPCS